jgi:hypothetical protein
MRLRAVTLVAASQASFIALLGVCVTVLPGLVLKRNEGGVSNYGVHWATVVPYSLAYVTDAGLLARAARRLDSPESQDLRRVVEGLCVVLVATLVTTYGYTSATVLRDLHFVVGAVLILYQCASVGWLWGRTRRGLAATLGVLTTWCGLALCVLATLAVWHVLFVGQMMIIVGYAPMLVGATRAATSGVTPGRQ